MHGLLLLLLCQLAGEIVSSALSLPIPGPVIGMVLMLALLSALPRLVQTVRPVAQGMLSHLSLLFVPAGVGVVGHLSTLGTDVGPLLLAVFVSTILAIGAGALTFVAVARLSGASDD